MTNEAALGLYRRLWIYQAERFPLVSHGLLVAVIAASGVGFSVAARDAEQLPGFAALIVAFLVAFGFFFQLRVADEYKDLADDSEYRPYRPVPRGLVTLRELAVLAAVVAVLQLGLTVWLGPALLGPLLAVWAYMGLMRYEFFAPEWLKAHAVVYMLSHMVILPLIFVYITGCDWLAAGASTPPGLVWFLAAGYCNGLVFEMGRKIRAPDAEEIGVETYSKLWGESAAVRAWMVPLALAGLCATLAATAYGGALPIGIVSAAGIAGAASVGMRYVRMPTSRRAKVIENYSAIWMLAIYAGLGIVPGLMAAWVW
jgi:hypothetical protein